MIKWMLTEIDFSYSFTGFIPKSWFLNKCKLFYVIYKCLTDFTLSDQIINLLEANYVHLLFKVGKLIRLILKK